MTTRVRNDYYEWLLDMIHIKQEPYNNYYLLMKELMDIPFRWSIDRDSNRETDGKDLRSLYLGETIDDWMEEDCTVLEMLIGLAKRCEDNIMWDPDEGDRTYVWFWKMIDNLMLGVCSDDSFDKQLVRTAIDIMLDRRYKRDGSGGLFPIPGTTEDLRKEELWVQLSWYLSSVVDF